MKKIIVAKKNHHQKSNNNGEVFFSVDLDDKNPNHYKVIVEDEIHQIVLRKIPKSDLQELHTHIGDFLKEEVSK